MEDGGVRAAGILITDQSTNRTIIISPPKKRVFQCGQTGQGLCPWTPLRTSA